MVCSSMPNSNCQIACDVNNLPLSQATTLEQADKVFAEKLDKGAVSETKAHVPDDGTNACTFMALKICNELINMAEHCIPNGRDLLSIISNIAVSGIRDYPREVNKLHNKDKLYTLIDDFTLVRERYHLPNIQGISEELPFIEGVLKK